MDDSNPKDQPQAGGPTGVLGSCFSAIDANASPDEIVTVLNSIEYGSTTPELRSCALRAKATLDLRLGFGNEAMSYLLEARKLLRLGAPSPELTAIEFLIARTQTWRGDVREAARALLRATVAASASNDRTAIASAFAEAGRLDLELGESAESIIFFREALRITAGSGTSLERHRTMINLLQAFTASGFLDAAIAYLREIHAEISTAIPRQQFLAELEAVRIEIAQHNIDGATSALARAKLHVPQQIDPFEAIEYDEVAAELDLARSEYIDADLLLTRVIRRYADDDLAGREIRARLLHARVLDRLGRTDDAQRTLLAALRRAVTRGLSRLAAQARSELRSRGGLEGAWRPGDGILGDADEDGQSERFVRRTLLGTGGSGRVSRAYDLQLGAEVAVKEIDISTVYDPLRRGQLLASARVEIEAASCIEHPGVARVHGLVVSNAKKIMIVEEYINGPTLQAHGANGIGSFEAFQVLKEIAFALSTVHLSGVVHRDIKPTNIIMRDNQRPVIVDFGIAALGRPGRLYAVGTPPYSAPEQLRGQEVDARADLYSLGVVACELLFLPQKDMAVLNSRISSISARLTHRGRLKQLVEYGIPIAAAPLIATLLAPYRMFRPKSAYATAMAFHLIQTKLTPADNPV